MVSLPEKAEARALHRTTREFELYPESTKDFKHSRFAFRKHDSDFCYGDFWGTSLETGKPLRWLLKSPGNKR